ncbi:hypothetical protein NXW59_22425 [Bacteroides fragilis]|nr:hypothetical protein [Bacteroides fragilis]
MVRGNINNVGNYDYFKIIVVEIIITSVIHQRLVSVNPKPANETLGWEKVALTDIGLGFRHFQWTSGGNCRLLY